ncbi:MAG: hypothetical protein J5865_04715 [Lachnospiraceae bacterium]|nr:hypothetical protein [Lachnospiraceae bacterium]
MKGLKSLGCLLALLLAAVILLPSKAMAADVAINSTNFPDATFREFVKKYDKNSDGKLSASECKAVEEMNVSGKGIKSLKGLEYFVELVTLDCSNNELTELTLTRNLENIYCQGNKIKLLDVSDTWFGEEIEYGSGIGYSRKTDKGTYWDYEYDYAWSDDEPEYWGNVYVDKTTQLIDFKPKIDYGPDDVTTVAGKRKSFYVKAYGLSNTYQWYYKKPGETTWNKVSADAGKKAKYTLTVAEKHYGYQYRCEVTNPLGKVTSKAATLYGPIKITTQPKDVMVKKGAKATIKVVAEGNSALSYKWMVSDPGDTKYYTSAKKATYSHVMDKAEENGRKAYCVITDEDGNSIQTITVTLRYVTAKPKITSPTAATTKTVAKGKTATFTVKTGVKTKAGFTYQWQYRTSSTGTWKNVSAASGKTASYKLTVAKKHNGYQYRCKVTNPYGTTISKIFTLKVTS